jgi:periplasmic divalent cation tolerance protein
MATLDPPGARQETAYCLVLTTVSTAAQAESLARRIVEARLGACVQIDPLQSIYRWQGTVCNEPEYRLSIKTRHARLDELPRFIGEHHSYEPPEILQIPITAGSEKYLRWLGEETKDDPQKPQGFR